ncbi:MAG TPA: poly-gamma-glutamate hydrolase family protein [Acidimicrobiia bacterium]|nr:poly-gamma-glutamate hydrolase family protein [Acidimicrobiia bacterium]
MLDELLQTAGVQEQLTVRSRFGFCALHGGLEQGTAEVARQAAEGAGASYYAVVQPDDMRWHVPSHYYDPDHSSDLRKFLDAVDVIISVHGFGGVREADDRWTTALLGGSNRTLASQLGAELDAALPTYRWIRDLEAMPRRLRGLHPRNPVNRPVGGGVQLELPPRIRRPGADFDALAAVLAASAQRSEM